MNRKILHIVNGEFYAGAERVQDLLAARLPEHGYEVGFASLKPGEFAAMRHAQAAPLYPTPMPSRFDPLIGARLAALARREGYVAFHTHTVRSLMAGWLASLQSNLPLVHHVHSPVWRDTESPLRNRLNAGVEALCARRALRLIAVSPSLQRELLSAGFREDKIRLVRNGVPSVKAANDWQAPATTWTLGMIALFRPRKGVEVLLRATAALRRQNLPVRLRLVGGFETAAYERNVKSLAHDLGLDAQIDWIGFTSDVAAELGHMNLFAVPSLFGEGLPMVLLEAMAAGLPVVGAKIEGVADVLGQGAGVLVEPGDSEALASALTGMIGQGAGLRALADRGFAEHRDFYSDTAMAAGVAAVYREIGL
jgi:phosphatidylinositol alpha-mannosyltransferase